MSWLDRNVHWVLLTCFVVTTLVAIGVAGVGALAVVAGILGGAGLGALVADAATVLMVTVVLLAADFAFAVAFVVTLVRKASLPTSERLAAFFELVERLLPPLGGLALSERFEPTVEERKREIKRRYVDGELSERGFEREMRDLLDETEPDPATVEPVADLDDVDAGQERVDEYQPRSRSGSRSESSSAGERPSGDRRETERE